MDKEFEDNKVVMTKSQVVALDNRKAMYMMCYYHSCKEDIQKSFFRCVLLKGPVISLLEKIEGLYMKGPANFLKMGDLGLPCDTEMFWTIDARRRTVGDFRKVYRARFKNATFLEDFLKRIDVYSAPTSKYKHYYTRTFEDIDLMENEKFEDMRWYVWTRPKKPVGRPKETRVIY